LQTNCLTPTYEEEEMETLFADKYNVLMVYKNPPNWIRKQLVAISKEEIQACLENEHIVVKYDYKEEA